MKKQHIQRLISGSIALIIGSSVALANDFEITSYTIDGGGGYSAGGSFELEGTIGQPDAGFMSGGAFNLEGGFWPRTKLPACACLGDRNGDGTRDGGDIQQFTLCLINSGSCQCADVNETGGVTIDDLDEFVSTLLSGSGCSKHSCSKELNVTG